LLDARLAEQEAARARLRRTQVGTGDRSAKIRTYNFPQNRMTDHRIGLDLYGELDRILGGDLDDLVEALQLASLDERLREGSEGEAAA
jgi:peptide chain release factor 1